MNRMILIACLSVFSLNLKGQQWGGSGTTTGSIYRSGSVASTDPTYSDINVRLNGDFIPNIRFTRWTGAVNHYQNAFVGQFWNTNYSNYSFAIGVGQSTSGDQNFVERVITIPISGNVGIGTETPDSKLSVMGQTKLINPAGRTLLVEKENDDSWITFHDPGDLWYSFGIDRSNGGSVSLNYGGDLSSSQFVMTSLGKIGIGVSNPQDMLHVNGNVSIEPDGSNIPVYLNFKRASDGWIAARIGQAYSMNLYGGHLIFETNDKDSPTDLVERMRITYDGKIGIGTSTPSELLSVNGTIRSKEIKVEATGWPDYVFQEGYDLPTLEETKAYITENKHLPEIPSAKEMEANGVALGEMNMLLLKKIEELTLHLIEMKEENQEMKERISNLENTRK